MKFTGHLAALLMGAASLVGTVTDLQAQATVTVQQSARSRAIAVPVNRGVVIEVSEPFTELAIANPNIADISTLSDTAAYVLGKSPGRTSLTVIGENGRLLSNVEVRVSPDIEEFKERLSEILPREQIEVRTANDGIVLSGRVTGARTLSRAMELAEMYAPEKVTNLMMVAGTQQVMLKVRFAEMERAVAKGLSSQLGIRGTGSNGSGTLRSAPQMPGGAQAFGGLGLSYAAGDLAVNLMLEALEEKGLVRLLAEPNLVAISGEEAQFLAGGEYPVPVATNEDTITIEYKPFGVELVFTPVVVDGTLINLKIATTVSAIDTGNRIVANGLAVDAFKVRRATTSVELRDGQSFSIAGLLQDEYESDINQLPWIADVPVLGLLFRSSAYKRKQSELVVIVTANLVSPLSGAFLGDPTDRVTLPSESEFFLRGETEARKSGQIASQGFQGAHGYVFD